MRRRLVTLVIAAVFAAVALTSLALGATTSIYDFNGHAGQFTSQVRLSGTKYVVGSLTLLCGSTSYVSATPKTALSSSGKFSYSGSATLISGSKQKKSKTTVKVSATISISKKTGTAKASTTAKGCKSFSGKLRGYVVPIIP
jgi:hypothetical protein